jgi:hypothetical protein
MPDFDVIQIFHPDNTFNILRPSVDVDFTIDPLVLADLNNNFQLEILAVGSNYNNNLAYVYAWQPDGTQAPGFPITVQDQNNLKSWRNHARILVGDFDGGGSKEVVVQEGLTSTTYVLRLFGHDGTAKTWNAPVLTGLPFAMAAADLDHSGKLETILFAYNGPQAILHVFQPDGSERPGWPVDVTALSGNQFAQAFLAVGDFNRDGHEEIVLSHETEIFLFNSDGTKFSSAWPLRTSITGYGAALIGDVNGDGFPEIVTTLDDASAGFFNAHLLAIRKDGTVAKSWQLTGSHGLDQYAYPGPTLGDFNQKGTTEIAVAYEVTGVNVGIPGVVTILDTHAPFDAKQNDWPMMFQNGQDNPVLLRTSPSALALTLAGGTNPSVVGDTLTFNVTVAPNTANGAVQFLDSGIPISGILQLSNSSVSFSTSALALGSHSITARYTGSSLFNASVSPALVQTVVKGNTSVSIALTGGANPSVLGDALTFTANVTPSTATGSVTFFDGGNAISGNVILTAGSASVTINSLSVGTHSITAQYSGDATFNQATSPVFSQTVNSPKPTPAITLALTAGTNPSTFGNALTFTSSVSPSSATGSVVFFDGTIPLSGSVPLVGGTASFTTAALSGGNHTITAQYSGDANFNGATSTVLLQSVAKAATAVELDLVRDEIAVPAGTPLQFVAAITPGTATGTVLFLDADTAISDPAPVNNGFASFTTASLAVGTHYITARYNGSADFNAATSMSLKVKVK